MRDNCVNCRVGISLGKLFKRPASAENEG